jgi:integrative and conjugative element protein (TIGR02256 family)
MSRRPSRARRIDGRLWLTPALVEKMTTEAERTTPLETGGVLLGYLASGGDIVAVAAIGPGPKATHRRRRFEPDSSWQREQIAREYEASGRVHTYLGDWHSHPGGGATPSRRDERTARHISRHRAARARQPLMVILSHTTGPWMITPYRFVRPHLVKIELTDL